MLEHIDADDDVERSIGIGQCLAHAHVVADRPVMVGGVRPRSGYGLRRRVNAGHDSAAIRYGLGHEAAGTAQI